LARSQAIARIVLASVICEERIRPSTSAIGRASRSAISLPFGDPTCCRPAARNKVIRSFEKPGEV
jgi:hypothetical protein